MAPVAPRDAFVVVAIASRIADFAIDTIEEALQLSHTNATWRDAVAYYSSAMWLRLATTAPSHGPRSLSTCMMRACGRGVAWLAEAIVRTGALRLDKVYPIGTQPLKFAEAPLGIAARNGHLDVVALLLGAGASVNFGYDDAAFSVAWRAGHTETARLLLRHGACTSFAWADIARSDDVSAAESLVALLTSSHDEILNTGLEQASVYGATDVALMLLAAGARPSRLESSEKQSPLASAARAGNVTIVRALLAADPAIVNLPSEIGGRRPILEAISRHDLGTVMALLDPPRRRPSDGEDDEDADIVTTSCDVWSPSPTLSFAQRFGGVAVMRTPLMEACMRSNADCPPEVVAALLRAGAAATIDDTYPDDVDLDGHATALMHACHTGNSRRRRADSLPKARLLLDAGADVNYVADGNSNFRNESALSLAVRCAANVDLIRLLLERGATVTAQVRLKHDFPDEAFRALILSTESVMRQ